MPLLLNFYLKEAIQLAGGSGGEGPESGTLNEVTLALRLAQAICRGEIQLSKAGFQRPERRTYQRFSSELVSVPLQIACASLRANPPRERSRFRPLPTTSPSRPCTPSLTNLQKQQINLRKTEKSLKSQTQSDMIYVSIKNVGGEG